MLFSIFGTESIGQTSTCNLSKSSFDGRAKRMFCIFVNATALHAFWKGLAHFDHWCITCFIISQNMVTLNHSKENTEWSNWKLSKWNGCRTESMHFSPYVGKAKICLRGGRYFEKCKQICRLTNAYWLYQYRVKSAPFQFCSRLFLIIFNWNALYS